METSLAVLAVDDQPEVRRLVCLLLRRAGYTVHEASSGEEALAFVQAWHPVLVVMDCQMPGLGGEGALAGIRAAGIRTPVVMVSGDMNEERALRLAALGATRCLHKLDLDEALLPAVADALDSGAR